MGFFNDFGTRIRDTFKRGYNKVKDFGTNIIKPALHTGSRFLRDFGSGYNKFRKNEFVNGLVNTFIPNNISSMIDNGINMASTHGANLLDNLGNLKLKNAVGDLKNISTGTGIGTKLNYGALNGMAGRGENLISRLNNTMSSQNKPKINLMKPISSVPTEQPKVLS